MSAHRFLLSVAAAFLLLPSLASAQNKEIRRDVDISVPGLPFSFTGTMMSSSRETGANWSYKDRWWGAAEYEGEKYHFMSSFSASISAANGAVPGTEVQQVHIVQEGEGVIHKVFIVYHFTYSATGELVVEFTFER